MKSLMEGSGDGRLVSKAELSMTLGVTRHAIDRMVAEGCPYVERGGQKGLRVDWKFNSAAVVRWLCDTDVAEEIERLESGGEMLKRLHPEDPRYAERVTAAEIRKLELAELQGKTLLKEDARRIIGEEYEVVRGGLREIPSKAAKSITADVPGCAPKEKIEQVLSREVEDVLTCLTADCTV